MGAPSKEAAPDLDSAPLAAGNCAWAPSASQKRNRRILWSRHPFGSGPNPWQKNAGKSRKGIIIAWQKNILFKIASFQSSDMFENKQCAWLTSTQRLAEAQELNRWRQMRQSIHRYLRRMREDGQERLSSIKLWRGDIHLIEGERQVLVSCMTKYSLAVNPLFQLLRFFHAWQGCSARGSCLTSPSCAS